MQSFRTWSNKVIVLHFISKKDSTLTGAEFAEVVKALSNGKSVRQERWEADRCLVVAGQTVVQMFKGKAVISDYNFDWRDIKRKDWRILA